MSKLFELAALDIPSIHTPSEHQRPLVVRSGGADSTLMCLLLLKAGIAFDYFYVQGDHGPKKGFVEKLAILKQDRLFKDHLCPIVRNTFEKCRELETVTVSTQIHMNGDNLRSSQAVTWLIAAMRHLDRRHNAVYYAYLSSDQASCLIAEMRKAWEAMVAMTLVGCKSIPIEFPMLLMNKTDVIYGYLTESDDRLYQATWSCQLPRHALEGGYAACIGSDETIDHRTCSTCSTRRTIEDANIIRKPPIWKGESFLIGDNGLVNEQVNKEAVEVISLDDIKEIES